MEIRMDKKYTISGVGLAQLCQLTPMDEREFKEEILQKCVKVVEGD